MNLMKVLLIITAVFVIFNATPVFADRTNVLNVCQELMNSARGYEARASFHARTAKTVQMQIENMARLPKDQNTSMAIDNLFTQYDENRVLEAKFRELYRQSSEEAKKCMKSAE